METTLHRAFGVWGVRAYTRTRMRVDERRGAPFAAFWAHYLLHHQKPFTRRLHFVGSLVCLVGFALALVTASPFPALAALFVGYLCAFAGHWWIERNRPLTFEHPIRAGLSNWRLFGVECLGLVGIGGGFEGALSKALAQAPEVVRWSVDSGSQ